MAQEEETPRWELVHRLTSRIANDDPEWASQITEVFRSQSSESLTELSKQSGSFNALELEALSLTLGDYVHGFTPQDNSRLVSDPVPAEEFFLRLVFSLIPLVVEDHRPMLGQLQQYYNGDSEELAEEDLYQSVSAAIHSMVANLLPEERSLRIARGCYLHENCSRNGELPSDDDLTWLSVHALEVLPFAESVYHDGVFDRSLAEEKLRIETPVMREGVL